MKYAILTNNTGEEKPKMLYIDDYTDVIARIYKHCGNGYVRFKPLAELPHDLSNGPDLSSIISELKQEDGI